MVYLRRPRSTLPHMGFRIQCIRLVPVTLKMIFLGNLFLAHFRLGLLIPILYFLNLKRFMLTGEVLSVRLKGIYDLFCWLEFLHTLHIIPRTVWTLFSLCEPFLKILYSLITFSLKTAFNDLFMYILHMIN